MSSTTKLPICEQDTLRDRIVAGDAKALDDLFRCSREALTRYLATRCGNAYDADDALQSTFESATRFLDGYRGDATPKGWLFRVAANACTRMRRGQKNNAALHIPLDERGVRDARGGAFVDVLVDPGVDAEGRATSRAGVVFDAIEALEAVDRSVILLRDGEGMSAKETADALGLSEAAVKSRLFRARRAVRLAAGADAAS